MPATVFNANNQQLIFDTKSPLVGDGTGDGDIVRFSNVITIGGQVIDAVVTTTFAGATVTTYDGTSAGGTANFFGPNLNIPEPGAVGGDGGVRFTVDFYQGGTYTGVGTGQAVTLQNVVVNSYDIDSTGSSSSQRQFQDFKGFARYELLTASNLVPTVLPDGSVRFLYTPPGSPENNGTYTADAFRVKVYYDSISSFDVLSGASKAASGTWSGTAYFALDFSVGPPWGGPTTITGTPAPQLSYSAGGFTEAAANDGSMSASITITLTNGTFTGTDGHALAGVAFANVPANLVASVTRVNGTQATLTLSGNASAHANADDIANLTVTFGNLAFASGNAGAVTGASRGDLTIDFTDGSSPTLSIDDVTVSESAGNAVFTVTLSAASASSVTVDYATTNGTATAGSDYTATSGTLTFAPGDTSKTISVPISNDAANEPGEGFSVSLSNATNATITDSSGAGTITDNDPVGMTLGTISRHTTEAGQNATFTVVLDTIPASDVTVSLASGDATEGSLSTTSLTFTPANWNTPRTVTVTGLDDSLIDGNITYNVNLSTSSADTAYNGLTGSVAVTNDDNDSASLVVGAISGHTTEAGGASTFTVRLSAQPTADVTVSVASADTTEGSVGPATLTFTSANWNSTQTVTVTGVDDPAIDGNITYAVNLSAASGDSSFHGKTGSATVVNDDNDSATLVLGAVSGHTTEAGGTSTFTVKLGAQPTGDVTVAVTSSDSSEGTVSVTSLTFTTANWNTPQTVTVTGTDDLQVDGNITYAANLAATSSDGLFNGLTGSATIVNDDNDVAALSLGPISRHTNEWGQSATFTAALSAQPTADVVVSVSSNDSSEGSVSPVVLTYTPANWNTPQTVTVTGVDDPVVDGGIGYGVGLLSTSADAGFNHLSGSVAVTNDDNDVASLGVSGMTAHTNENGQGGTFIVVLSSQPTADVVVTIGSDDPTEGLALPGSLIFTPSNWNMPQTVGVGGVDDPIVDGSIRYNVGLSTASADPAYNHLSQSVSVINDDNDGASLVLGTINRHTTEAGQSATFTIALSAQPTAEVTVTVSSADDTEGAVGPTTLRFTPANWNLPQLVTVTGLDDPIVDGDLAFQVNLATTSTEAAFNNLAGSVQVINDDNESAALVTSTSTVTTGEDGTSDGFTLRLSAQPTAEVVITLNSSDATEGSVGPTQLVFTPANWNQPQTVTVRGVDDTLIDGPVPYLVGMKASSADSAFNGLSGSVAATNRDNDVADLLLSGTDPLRTSEAGQSDSFTVRLSSMPSASVVITVASDDSTEGQPAVSRLTFTPTNWNVPQTVQVLGVDDPVVDGALGYNLLLRTSSTDLDFNGRTASLPAVNADNDVAGLSLSGTEGLRTSEDGKTAQFALKLSARPVAAVVVTLTDADPTEAQSAPRNLTFTPDNWDQPQTVTVQGVDDTLIDGSIAANVVLSAASTDPHFSGQVATVSVVNDDNDKLVTTTTQPPVGAEPTPTTKAGDLAQLVDPSGKVVSLQPITAEAMAAGQISILPPGLDDGVYTFHVQILDPSGTLKSDKPITFTIVSDLDDVAPSVERAAHGGDINSDGVQDWQQFNVSQLPLTGVRDFQAGAAAPAASFGALLVGNAPGAVQPVALDPGAQLSGVKVVAVPTTLPAGLAGHTEVDFIVGARNGEVLIDQDPARSGLQVRVVMDLASGFDANTVLTFGGGSSSANSSAWHTYLDDGQLGSLDDGAALLDTNGDGRPDRVVLTLTDGAGGDADGVANGRISAQVILAQELAKPVYSVLLASGDRYYSADPTDAAHMAQGTGNRFEGVVFDSLDASQGGGHLSGYHQPFTDDWTFAANAQTLPYACYLLAPSAAGFSAAAPGKGPGQDVHQFVNADGQTQFALPAAAAALVAQGFTDLGALFNTTARTAFGFDPEGYLIANRARADIQALVKQLDGQYSKVTDAGFVDAVEQSYLAQVALTGLPHGDAASAADLNSTFGTHFGG